jgi:hypothetical protein
MYTGGDGYTALAGGTDVAQPGDGLLEVVVDYIRANTPVSPPIPGTGPCAAPTVCRIVKG